MLKTGFACNALNRVSDGLGDITVEGIHCLIYRYGDLVLGRVYVPKT